MKVWGRFGKMENDLAIQIGNFLKKEQKTLATAESCTGGLIASLITDVSGSSSYFKGGVVSYTNEIKNKILGVKKETLEKYSAISKETAWEMAEGVQKLMQTDYAISVTGNAGPLPSEGKEVGLVYFGIAIKNEIYTFEKHFLGTRNENKISIANMALKLFLDNIR